MYIAYILPSSLAKDYDFFEGGPESYSLTSEDDTLHALEISVSCMKLSYSSTCTTLVKPLPKKATSIIRRDLSNNKILLICPLKRGHPSYKATFSLQNEWP
jgi:hypothetical protein